MNTDKLWLRTAGVVILIFGLIVYDPTSISATQRLLIPLLMAIGSWALVQNVAAVTLGVAVLAFIHSDLMAASWIDRLAYPLLAATAALLLVLIGAQRFRARIRSTHEARWAERSIEDDR